MTEAADGFTRSGEFAMFLSVPAVANVSKYPLDPSEHHLLTDIPLQVLRSELARRQEGVDRPACGSTQRGKYNTSLHVIALALILGLSTLGECSICSHDTLVEFV